MSKGGMTIDAKARAWLERLTRAPSDELLKVLEAFRRTP